MVFMLKYVVVFLDGRSMIVGVLVVVGWCTSVSRTESNSDICCGAVNGSRMASQPSCKEDDTCSSTPHLFLLCSLFATAKSNQHVGGISDVSFRFASWSVSA